MLHLLNSLLEGNHIGNLEEGRLHDGIRARTQTQLGSNLRSVDDIEVDVVLGQICLHVVRQRAAGRLGIVRRVQEERTALLQALQHIILIYIRRNVASHKVGRRNQIRRRNRVITETEVRRGVTTRLLRVIREVSLAILVGRTTDDLDRVLVGTYRTVGTQTEEQTLERTGLGHRNLLTNGQREVRYVVHDTNREVVLRLGLLHVLEYGQHLGGRRILRRETVAATDNLGLNLLAVEHRLHVHIERLALGTRLLRAVQHANLLHRSGNHVEEILLREGTIEVYGDKTHLLALLAQIVDRLLDGLRNRTHGNNHVLGLGVTVVNEGCVLTTRDGRNLLHRLGYHVRHCIVELVASLTSLEIDIGVLGRTARYGMLGVERGSAELLQCLTVEHGRQFSLVNQLNLLNLMRGTETVEEVQEGNASLQGNDVSHTGQVHHLLNRRSCQHSKAGLTGGHHVLVVTENREGVRSQRTSRHVEDTRQQLTGNLIHVGNHQQQTLRSGEGRGQSTRLQRAVYGTGSTGLRLHLNHLYGLTEDVLATLRSPLVHVLCHGRRRGDGVNSGNLREHISHVSCCIVTITSDKFLFCHFL